MNAFNIVILSQPRTGSSLVSELFCCFENTLVLNELFTENNVLLTYTPREWRPLTKLMQKHPKLGITHLEKSFSNVHRVFKIHLWQMFKFDLEFVLSMPNTVFILITRQNFLEQYVSAKLAYMSNSFSTNDERRGTSSKDITFELDINDYKEHKAGNIYNIDMIKKKLKDLNHNFLDLNYEDDLENYDLSIFEKIRTWASTFGIVLNQSDYILSVYQKQNFRQMHEIISNWDSIKDLI